MTRYEHRQVGTTIMLTLFVVLIVFAVLAFYQPESRRFLLWTAAAIVLGVALFSSLTIEITEADLRWWFGPGLIRRKVALARIQDARADRSTFLDGWGIHFTARGWLYNVSGTGVVIVTLKDGKQFMLGTDEPEQLRDAIKQTLTEARPFDRA
jgi:hypothetical protein